MSCKSIQDLPWIAVKQFIRIRTNHGHIPMIFLYPLYRCSKTHLAQRTIHLGDALEPILGALHARALRAVHLYYACGDEEIRVGKRKHNSVQITEGAIHISTMRSALLSMTCWTIMKVAGDWKSLKAMGRRIRAGVGRLAVEVGTPSIWVWSGQVNEFVVMKENTIFTIFP
jgi:hypothetical protein